MALLVESLFGLYDERSALESHVQYLPEKEGTIQLS